MKRYVPTWSTLCLVIICFVCFVEIEFQAVGQDDLSLLCRPGRSGAWGHSLFLPLPPEDEDYSGGVSAFTCWAFSPAPGVLSATVTKSNLGGLPQLSGSSLSPTEGSQGRSFNSWRKELKPKQQRNAVSLTCSSWFACRLLHISQAHLPRYGAALNGLGLPRSINNQDVPNMCTGLSNGDKCSLRVSLPRSLKLTTTVNSNNRLWYYIMIILYITFLLMTNLDISPSWQLWIILQWMRDCRLLHTVLISCLA